MKIKHTVCPPNTRQLTSTNIFIENGFDHQVFLSLPRVLFFDKRIKSISQMKFLMFLYYAAQRYEGSVYLTGIGRSLGWNYEHTKSVFRQLQKLGYITVKMKKAAKHPFIIINFIQDPREYHIRDMLGVNRQRNKKLALRFQRVYKHKKEPKVLKDQVRICGCRGWYVSGPLAGKAVKEEFRHLPTPEGLKKEIEKWRIISEEAGQKKVLIKSTAELKEELEKKTCTSGSLQEDTTNLSQEESVKDVVREQSTSA
ncbi:MAG: hypothetical protein WC648_04150 [Candidatus Paceibacterota bacterium]|jgi:hypothetical protein